MKHLSEEQLVEHFYGEGSDQVGTHMASCDQCAWAFAELTDDLSELKSMRLPERDAAYGERVWQSIGPRLEAYTVRKKRWLQVSWLKHRPLNTVLGQGLGYAVACTLLLSAAFFAGRLWEQQKKQAPIALAAKHVQPPVMPQPQRVVVVVLGDHLDRSERLLVELKHADTDNEETIGPLRDEARTLLAANQTFRQKAREADDPELKTALKHLDDVLTKLTDQPGGLNAQSIQKLQNEMRSDQLLFEVRVLRARTSDRQIRGIVHTNGGTI